PANLLGIDGACFRLLVGDKLVVGGTWGSAKHVMRKHATHANESLSGLVLRKNGPVSVSDLRDDAVLLPEHKHGAIEHGVVSYLGVPLQYRDRAIGVLNVYGCERRQFTAEQIDLLKAFAAQAAIAIENSRLHGAAVRRGQELSALLRATRTVMAGLDLEDILKRIVQEASHIAGTPHAKLLLLDHERQVLRVSAGVGGQLVAGDELPLDRGYSGGVALSGRPLFV